MLNELLEIFRNMSGLEISESDTEMRFQDLGFDSLFLAQANADLRKRFKVRIGFRQLLEEAPTPAALARYIESVMPPDVVTTESNGQPRSISQQETQPEVPSVDALVQSSSSNSGDRLTQPIASIRALVSDASNELVDVAQKHLELMEAQIRLLKNATG